jgi:hypothetical protein
MPWRRTWPRCGTEGLRPTVCPGPDVRVSFLDDRTVPATALVVRFPDVRLVPEGDVRASDPDGRFRRTADLHSDNMAVLMRRYWQMRALI